MYSTFHPKTILFLTLLIFAPYIYYLKNKESNSQQEHLKERELHAFRHNDALKLFVDEPVC